MKLAVKLCFKYFKNFSNIRKVGLAMATHETNALFQCF